MNKHSLALRLAIFFIGFSLAVISCKKDAKPPPPRTIWYILYTKQDFSNDRDTIRFRLRMQATGTTGRILLDSGIAPMTINAVPDSLHRIIFTKVVPPGHDQEKLVVGFIYDIDNVGESWFLDSCGPGQTTKKVEYNFQ